MGNNKYNFEVPKIDEFDFIEALFKTGETWGDLYTRVNGSHCDTCSFKEKCDKLSDFFEEQDTLVYCEDLINIMIGKKQIEDFI